MALQHNSPGSIPKGAESPAERKTKRQKTGEEMHTPSPSTLIVKCGERSHTLLTASPSASQSPTTSTAASHTDTDKVEVTLITHEKILEVEDDSGAETEQASSQEGIQQHHPCVYQQRPHGPDSQTTVETDGLHYMELEINSADMSVKPESPTPAWPWETPSPSLSPLKVSPAVSSPSPFQHGRPLTACWAAMESIEGIDGGKGRMPDYDSPHLALPPQSPRSIPPAAAQSSSMTNGLTACWAAMDCI